MWLPRPLRRPGDSKHTYPVAENHLNRQFNPIKPGQAWVSDLTYIATGEGWLYLTIIMDLYDRKVIAGPPVRLGFKSVDEGV